MLGCTPGALGVPCISPFLTGILISCSVQGSRQWEGLSTDHWRDWGDESQRAGGWAGAGRCALRSSPARAEGWSHDLQRVWEQDGFFLSVPGVCWGCVGGETQAPKDGGRCSGRLSLGSDSHSSASLLVSCGLG